ncbi:hypothetical protein FOCC_FOCC006956 [Frankliniella occidentalis]|nr:hypothetical protein FOCC_FOCC006956 [Frankliniella occidentalis]
MSCLKRSASQDYVRRIRGDSFKLTPTPGNSVMPSPGMSVSMTVQTGSLELAAAPALSPDQIEEGSGRGGGGVAASTDGGSGGGGGGGRVRGGGSGGGREVVVVVEIREAVCDEPNRGNHSPLSSASPSRIKLSHHPNAISIADLKDNNR